MKPFQGIKSQNQVVSPSGTSASVSIKTGTRSVRLVNTGINQCNVRVGKGSQIASSADTTIPPFSAVALGKSNDDDTVAFISASGTSLHVQPGGGGALMKGVSSFLPSLLSEVKGWYAADVSKKTFNGPKISQLDNLMGGVNNAIPPLVANQPLFVSVGPSGLPSILFDGVDDFFDLVAPSVFGMQNADWEVFFVAASSDAVNIQYLLAGGLANYDTHMNLPSPSNGFRLDPNGSIDRAAIGTIGLYNDGLPHIFGARVDSNVGIVRVDGIDGIDTAATARSSDNTTLRIGTRGNGAFPMNGYISEAIICQPALSVEKRGYMESYCNNKYGL